MAIPPEPLRLVVRHLVALAEHEGFDVVVDGPVEVIEKGGD
jgi:hypothetical protein